jgi:UDP-N-acetylglucosamine 1-carboxyvinyltransferase
VLAEGTTTILAAATEPEIVDLGDFLTKCGAKIEGLGTPTICVTGVQRLRGVTHRVIPDRIEAATLLMAAAITGGSLTVRAIRPEHLDIVLIKLAEAGFVIEKGPDWVSIRAHGVPLPVEIIAEPYPGMATDIQPQWTALLSLAGGRSTVEDRVFPNRFMHLAELNRLGASIQRLTRTSRNHTESLTTSCHFARKLTSNDLNGSAVIDGVGQLTGAIVEASDLRAAAALVIAALASRGETILRQSEHLDRGYQQLDQKLTSLGARIERYP